MISFRAGASPAQVEVYGRGAKATVKAGLYIVLTALETRIEGMRVLIVEDEPALVDALARGLRREGMAVDVAEDGSTALAKAQVNDYDVVLLDRDLPVVHGDDVCRALAGAQAATRILMLTASAQIDERVEGLELGADDYLPKPFAFAELVARVRALGRRAQRPRPPILSRGDIALDPSRRVVTRSGRFGPSPRRSSRC
jgi:DNA-binding response OmpR family regulator